MWQRSYNDSPTLFLVPTPIGNMEDMTVRAINVLKSVDVVFSEDTRVTKMLFNYFNIEKKLISLHDHNENLVKEKVLDYLKNGSSVGLVTDRGTPIISDPGFKTVKYVSDNGYNVVGLPGANAFVPALIVSGISPQPFIFYGFLDHKNSKKRAELISLKKYKTTMIFYEAPHRILSTMELMLEIFGDRQVSLSRELSKKFESIYRGKISDLIPTLENIKGEFVIVVSGCVDNCVNIDNKDLLLDVDTYIRSGMKKMDAIKVVADEYNMSKSDVYSLYHNGRS